MFFTLVDELNANPKIRSLLDRNLAGDATGTIACTLWTLAGTASRGAMTDGVITRADTVRIMLNHDWADLGARLLVEVGLWHDAVSEAACETCTQHLASCSTCRPLRGDEYRFHDWWQRGYDHGVQAKLNIAKKKELQNKQLRAQVWERDCTPGDPETAPCRLCGTLLKRQDRKSDRAPETDHVDPWLAIGAANLITVCRSCNRTKGQRTPEDAGMTLLPPPSKDRSITAAPEDSRPHRAAGSPSSSSAHSQPTGSAGSRVTVPVQVPGKPLAGGEGRGSSPSTVEGRRPSPPASEAARAAHPAPPPDQRSSTPLIPARIRETELSSRAHAGVVGSGDGDGDGDGEGSGGGRGDGDGAGRRRRRRRRGSGRHRGSPSAGTGEGQGRAGSVPPVDFQRVPGKEGSPFRNHHGPWVDRDEVSTCSKHGCDRPCWKCEEERG
ncbi:HNH endonuclease signature motif containing protein [Brachybacterium kimchii]|uniref:HNH endonuclease n=1 Tax=Brachybacterium kimchii TaxID=2942909 RepID=A0ABY4NA52_9MICO|nr:HNH endonuclease signature motif containing protein [Brachybacterium kimchii]UQN30671.1 HNH endonuclease [Brachybacterium kimchii]